MKRTTFRRAIATAVVALTAALGAITASPTEASAWSYASIGGSPGGVTLPTVYVGDLVMPNGSLVFTLYSNANAVAYRSPASSGTQIVNGVYVVEQWVNNRWVVTAQSPILTGQIGAGQSSLQFPRAYLQPNMARGYFRVTWLFNWVTPTGAVLGSTTVVGNLASDHVCATRSRLCQSSTGFVRTGGYLTNAW